MMAEEDQKSSTWRWRPQLPLLFSGVVSLLLVLTGRLLTPARVGYGTHQQLGLPACPFLSLTGLPCPSCGLTTSFSHAAHFDFGAALVVQPFGLVVFLLVMGWIPASLILACRGHNWSALIESRQGSRILYLLILLYLLGWIYNILRTSDRL
jgi:hypothetical protein